MTWKPGQFLSNNCPTNNTACSATFGKGITKSGICLNPYCDAAHVTHITLEDPRLPVCEHCKTDEWSSIWVERNTHPGDIDHVLGHILSSFIKPHNNGKTYDIVTNPNVNGISYYDLRSKWLRKFRRIAANGELNHYQWQVDTDGSWIPVVQMHLEAMGRMGSLNMWRDRVVSRAFELAKERAINEGKIDHPEDQMEAYWEEEDRYYDRLEEEHHDDMRPLSKVLVRNEAGEPIRWDWV
jgi:hypothetical protein